jgi:peptide/nickel transport system permease protein
MIETPSFRQRLFRHIPAVAGSIVIALLIVMAGLAPLIFPEGPWALAGRPLLWPGENPRFPLGTDMLGRDLAAALFHGARVSLAIAATATVVAVIIGTTIGAISAYYGGMLGSILMAVTETFQTAPPFVMAVVVVATFKPSLFSIVVAISFVSWPGIAQLVRTQFMQLMTREFVQAGIVIGMSDARLILTQLLPNSLTPIIVSGSLMIASAILLEAGLSFLGLGDPNAMSWGYVIGAGRDVLRTDWHITAIPGVAILFAVLAVNLVGEGLNDALNPRSRNR